MRDCLQLFASFFRIGLFTFGGGYAMLPMIQREVIEKHGWATEEEVLDYYAVGQCTPGVIAVNTATFVGFKKNGASGSIAATLGVVAPSVIIITVIAALLSNFAEYAIVRNAFAGIRICVCVLIVNSVRSLLKKSVVDKATAVVYIAVFALSVFTDISPIVYVLAACVAGIILKVILKKGEAKA